MAARGQGLFSLYNLYTKLLKIFLTETTGPISIWFCRNVPLVILLQDCSSHLDLSKNIAARGRGLFSLYICIENFKNLLVLNHWTDFHIILQKCSFGNPVARLFKPFGFVKKHGRQGGGAYFPYISLWKTLKMFSSETTGLISIWFCRNVPLVILLQDCSSRHDSLKNMAARGRG